MQIPATPLCDECIRLFEQTIVEQFQMPAAEALRQINAALAANPVTRGIVLELPRRAVAATGEAMG